MPLTASGVAPPPGAPAHLKLGPTLCGLAAIPLIIAPIDRAVDWGMDETLRKVFF